MPEQTSRVDELIRLLTRKLQDNRSMLERSLRFGRLTWRKKNGKTEVDLDTRV